MVMLRFDPDADGAGAPDDPGNDGEGPPPGRDGEIDEPAPGSDGEMPMPPLGADGAGDGVCAVSGADGSGNFGAICICAKVNGTGVVTSLIGEFPDRQRDGTRRIEGDGDLLSGFVLADVCVVDQRHLERFVLDAGI